MKNIQLILLIFSSILLSLSLFLANHALSAPVSDSMPAPTGSRLSGSATPRVVIQFQEPQEIERIRSLVNWGELESALSLSQSYVEYTENAGSSAVTRYSAYNALCLVHAKMNNYSLAIEVCSTAIDLLPSRWTALNTRGTVKLVIKDYAGALEDFEAALKNAGSRDEVLGVINHNIDLAKARM